MSALLASKAETLKKAEDYLRDLKAAKQQFDAGLVDGRYRMAISVRFGNRSVDLASESPGYYGTPKAIRGREMIALGMQKILNDEIEDAARNAAAWRADLAKLAADIASGAA